MTITTFVLSLLVILFLLYFLPFKIIGKYLYSISMGIESKIAGLHTKYTDIGNQRVAFFDNQNVGKPALLLLHGFSADRHIWLRFAKHFKDTHRVIIPDLLGHGDTPYSRDGNYASTTQAKMLVELVKQLDLKDVDVVGNSMGGMICATLLTQNDGLFSRGVLIDPAGAKSDFALYGSRSQFNPFLVRTLDEFKLFYKKTMAVPPPMPNSVLNYLGQKNYIDKFDQIQHQFADFFDIETFFDTPFEIQTCRWLVIWGKEDQTIPVSDAAMWQELTGTVPLIYEKYGHMPMIECPTKTAHEVKRFLNVE